MTLLYFIGAVLILIPLWILYPIQVLGKKRKPKGKLILVSNHLSTADPFLLAAHHNRQIYFLGKSEFTKNSRVLKAIFKWLGVVSIDRGKADLVAIRAVLKRINQGKTVGIYPEGTRNYTSEDIQSIKGGSVMFALKTNAPIVPMILLHRPKVFRRNIYITGDPIDFGELRNQKFTSEVFNSAEDILYDEMIKLQKTVRYYETLKGKEKKEFKRKVNNPMIKFSDIYIQTFGRENNQ